MPPPRRSRRLRNLSPTPKTRELLLNRAGRRRASLPESEDEKEVERRRSRSRSRSPASREQLDLSRNREQDYLNNLIQFWRDQERTRGRNVRLSRGVSFDYTEQARAMGNRFQVYRITYGDNEFDDLFIFLLYLSRSLRTELTDIWHNSQGITWSIQVGVHYSSGRYDNTEQTINISTSYRTIITREDINRTIAAGLAEIIKQHEDYQEGSSDWQFVEMGPYSTLYVRVIQAGRGINGGGRFDHLLNIPAGSYIPLPKWIADRKAVINVDNLNNECFKYAMEVAWHTRFNADHLPKNLGRSSSHPISHFDYGDLTFPIHPSDLKKFCALNKQYDIIFNVYHANEDIDSFSILLWQSRFLGKVQPNSPQPWIISLLVLAEYSDPEETQQKNTHWCYIKSLQKLVRHAQPKTKSERFLCDHCLEDFGHAAAYSYHREHMCGDPSRASVEVLPHGHEAYRYFRDTFKKTSKPFVIYADFESFNKPLQNAKATAAGSKKLTEHVAASYCFQVVCRTDPSLNWNEMYTTEATDWTTHGEDTIGSHFLRQVGYARMKIDQLINEKFRYPANISRDDKIQSSKEVICCICERSLKRGSMRHWSRTLYDTPDSWPGGSKEYYEIQSALKKERKSRGEIQLPSHYDNLLIDRNRSKECAHYRDKAKNNYRGAAHHACNYQADKYGKIPVVFHNLTGYDGHLVIQALTPENFVTDNPEDNFTCIPQAGDKFMSFAFGGLEFIDSFRFMGSSLDDLTDNLRKSGTNLFFNTQEVMKKLLLQRGVLYTPELEVLLMKKGQFPYEYFDGPDKLLETTLPPITAFFNTLKNEICTPEKYAHAQKVWQGTNCLSFRDYHDVYLLLDVCLLADVFENFRSLCFKEDKLEPLHYISLPGYTFDSALMFSKLPDNPNPTHGLPFEIELFKKGQEDMYQFAEASIRGGISMTPGRYAKANHEFIEEEYDPNRPLSHIIYWDANNLYGYAMSQELPYGDYRWVPVDNSIDYNEAIKRSCTDGDIGYIYEVDGFFPSTTHDKLKEFPPVPCKESIKWDDTSPYYKELCERFDAKHDDDLEKLMCSLRPKIRYKVYARSLKQYVKLGFVITKVHRVLSFNQANWLAAYIQHNTKARAKATNDFERDYYKLKNNAAYGKFIQDNRKFQTVKAVTNDDQADKYSWDLHMGHYRVINDSFVIQYMKRGRITLNSAIPIGSVILDHSKWLMYDFWYDKLTPVFKSDLHLCLTDTDSLCVKIDRVANPMQVMREHGLLEYMDLSDWPDDSSYYGYNFHDNSNKKVIGKFKDESVQYKIAGSKKNLYIAECVALRSKMYSLRFYGEDINKATAKGVSKPVKKLLSHEKYVMCLAVDVDNELERADMFRIGSKNNRIHSNVVNKVTISPHDTKSYLVDATHTVPYGHYSIPFLSYNPDT
jgi:hypothetical protein